MTPRLVLRNFISVEEFIIGLALKNSNVHDLLQLSIGQCC